MEGIFKVFKPSGPTSHDIIDKVRKITGEKKVGHAGTLDPLASGLLIIAIGRKYTKQISEFVGLDKEYIAEIKLGEISTTYDAEGEIKKVSNKIPSEVEIKKALLELKKQEEQLPPIFSAKKIKGKKAYELARQGKEVKLKPSVIKIYQLDLLEYNYPFLKIRTTVSSGTYVRSLASDLGVILKTGAYLNSLIRTKIDKYDIKKAADLEKLNTAASLKPYRIN